MSAIFQIFKICFKKPKLDFAKTFVNMTLGAISVKQSQRHLTNKNTMTIVVAS